MENLPVIGQSVHVMAKPIGPICNLDCAYCYYLDKENLYPSNERWRMPENLLRKYVRQYIEAQPPSAPEIDFAWQGGEPTLLGVEFFEQVVAFQKECMPPGKRCTNSLQTNGTLLDDAWCEFFKKNGFLVGLSIDGPAELHDPLRYDKKGRPTFDQVMQGWKLLKQHKVDHNLLVVLNSLNSKHPRKVYRFLREQGAEFIQFIPIVERLDPHGSEVGERSVDADQFGRFLCEVFDEWIRRDVGKVFVQIIDQALSAWLGMEPSLCVFRKQCGKALAMEHNGDLFSCDHFVTPEYKLGNINETPLAELVNSERQRQFGIDKEASLPEYCKRCDVRFVCNGECPKNRFIETPDGEPGLNYLCAGYKRFFRHIDRPMKLMAEELRHKRPAANVMRILREKAQSSKRSVSEKDRQSPPGRNDFCPCGSGKKFKRCCLALRR